MSFSDMFVDINRRLDDMLERLNGMKIFDYKKNRSTSISNFDAKESPYNFDYSPANNEKKVQVVLYDNKTDVDNFSESDDYSSDTEDNLVIACNSKPSKPEVRKYFKAKESLLFYPPSNNVKLALASNFSNNEFALISDQTFQNFLDQPLLSANNCHHIFKVLIEMEDVITMNTYVPLAQVNLVLNTTTNRNQYWIAIENAPNIDEVLKPFLDEVVIIPKASAMLSTEAKTDIDILFPHADESSVDPERKRFIATVDQVSKDRVYFHFKPKEDVHLSILTSKYDIIFRPLRLPMRYQHRALELLAADLKMRDYLFPTEKQECEQVPNINLQLVNHDISANPEQLQAVHHILSSLTNNAPYVIFGPPGTGKTTTIVESIIQLRLHQPGSRILVTAGSNSACDTIALRICKYFNSSLEVQAISNSSGIIRIFSKSVEQKGLQLIDETLLKHSNCKDGQHFYPAVEDIRKYGIIISTLSTVGKLTTGDIGASDFFTHIFVDEAGASTEPETLVGIMGTKSQHCKLILCGDHKQLGPVLKCERAAKLGLKVSMMERLLNSSSYLIDANGNYNRSLQSRLCRNYRSHPAIVGLYNKLFYNNELVANAKYDATHLASKWHILPNFEFPIIFQAVHGKFGKEEGSSSSFNQLEIQVLFWYLQRLLVDGIDGRPVDQADIGIITPYKIQVKRIQSNLNLHSWHNVNVGSVETFQGREKPIIIVSLVRSFSGLGFVKNPQRLNVLLSRAKSLLLLIGNPVTLRRNKDFRYIIEECKINRTYLHKKKQFPHLFPKIKQELVVTQSILPEEHKCIETKETQQEIKAVVSGLIKSDKCIQETGVTEEDHAADVITEKHVQEEVITQLIAVEENESVAKALQSFSIFLSIPISLLRINSEKYTYMKVDRRTAPAVQRYSKAELFIYGNIKVLDACDTNNNKENCENFEKLQKGGALKENQENNPNLLNISKLDVESNFNSPLSHSPKPFRRVYNLRSYAKNVSTPQTRSMLLQKIVQPCPKCPKNYIPGD